MYVNIHKLKPVDPLKTVNKSPVTSNQNAHAFVC